MGQYEVTGADASGRTKKILVDTDSPKSARAKARAMGLTPVEVKAADGAGISASRTKGEAGKPTGIELPFGGISQQDLSNMVRQLATLVKAHVPIVESLSALVDQIDNVKLRKVLMSIRQDVKEGRTIGDAFAAFPKIFDNVFVNMVRAGESSGRLDVVLLRLADFAEGRLKLKGKVQGAMTYPIIMVVVGTIIFVVLMLKVVPTITGMFNDTKQALPTPTVILIAASDFLQAHGFKLLVGVLGSAILLQRYIATKAGRERKDAFLLKAPLFGMLNRMICVSRFARTLGTLLSSGVPMLTALEITRNVVSNATFERVVEAATEQVREGRPLAYTLKQSGEFPPIVVHMVGVGEKTGELEQMLLNVAEGYEQQVEMKLGQVTTALEPLMLVGMAGAVGFIVMAILLPILDMQNFG